ncbi:MAG: C39 family peptidase [Methylobacter sp.]|uniref:C39 family peptidase n=1 Tax=Methylobacter sp. TaxID=2051955 RepID=UPI00272F3DA1|nr:C39 family peptidase [Methylobacter sp.]MDP1664641.1 C39 family peptidase [Methylobacter sp.]
MIRFFVKCVLLILPAFCSNAGSLNFNGIAGAGNYDVPVTTFSERRFKTVYKQQYDFSCGSATLASLLTYHYDDVVDEQSVFVDMYQNGDQQKIQKQGFSLLDIKLYLERRGYRSDGFKIKLDQLITANVPAITIINNNGYLHFVIIKGLNEQEVLVGDPAVGIKAMPRDEFEAMWENRILFLIHDKQDIAAKHFQDQQEWVLRVKAPLGSAVDRASLGLFNMLQPGRWDF